MKEMKEMKETAVKDLMLTDSNDNDEWTVIDTSMDQNEDGEVLTVGDILSTLPEDAFREYYILVKCILNNKTKTAEKLMHHMDKFPITNLQYTAVLAGLYAMQSERDHRSDIYAKH